MEIEGQVHPCLSLISNEDGTLRNEHCTTVSDDLSSMFESNILLKIQPTVTLCIEVEGTGSSIVGLTNGETTIPLYSLQFQHHSSVIFTLHLKENKQQVKATFDSKTSKICVDQEQGVKLDLKIFGGNFNIVLTQNGKDIMNLRTEASELHQTDAESETYVPDNDKAMKKKAEKTDDDKEDDFVDIKEETDQNEVLNLMESHCPSPPLSENTTVSSRWVDISFDNKMNELNEKNEEAKSSKLPTGQVDESNEPSNNKESELKEKETRPTGNMSKFLTRVDKIETVDIRTFRMELLTRMNARRLVNYFFQAKIISEEDMEEINEPDGRRKANERLLKILRNRNVSKQNVSEVLTRAEEEHLLDYMFPNEVKVKPASTQTENSYVNGSVCFQSRSGF